MHPHASDAPSSGPAGPGELSPWEDSPEYPHRIEDHVKVYLELEDGPEASGARWAVAAVTVDGMPLDGSEVGPYCDYGGHPLGARRDWDRQHQQAGDLDLPTAGELLPMLANALGAGAVIPRLHQTEAARQVLTEYATWARSRSDLSAAEAAGDVPTASDWQHSDDVSCELAERAVALLADLTGQTLPLGAPAATASTDVALMRAALSTPSTQLDRSTHEPTSAHRDTSGPVR